MVDQRPDTTPFASVGKTAAESAEGWNACTWEGARRDVLERAARMTFREKIIWLEEATRLALRISPAVQMASQPSSRTTSES